MRMLFRKKIKKIIAALVAIAIMQNYLLILGSTAIALEKGSINLQGAGNSDYLELLRQQEEQVAEEAQEESQEDSQETPELSGHISEEVLPEDTGGEENQLTEASENNGGVQESESQEEIPEESLPEQVFLSSVGSENSSIYKGFFYANIVSENKYETAYNYTETIELQDVNFIDEIDIEEAGDRFIFDTGVGLNIGENTYYRETLIPEEELNAILGTDGYVEISATDGEVLGIINSDSEKEDGNYVYYFDVYVDAINVKIINPIENGTINIKHIKAIKSELEYSRNQIEMFKNIETRITTKAIYNNINYWGEIEYTNLINLEETESRMDIELSSTDFSTMLENEIAMYVTLRTNEERYDLFQDPTIEILMPSAVEDVTITNINLLYKNGLSINSWEVQENDSGKKVIKVNLEGNQTEYTPGSMQEGTTLVIYTKINVDRLTSNTDEKIKMTYTNKNSSKLYYEVNGYEAQDVDIRFVSREGILKANSISNYNSNLEGIYEFNEEVQIGSLDVGGERQVAAVKMAVVNNYEKELENVSIIGRIPTQGSIDGNGNDLGSTVNTVLINAISYSGVSGKIYYSYMPDIEENSEEWVENVPDFSLIKSYKIVLDNPMQQGDKIEFNYQLLIPEDLNYNEKLYSSYQVNYSIDNQTITENSILGLATEEREIILEETNEQFEEEVALTNEQGQEESQKLNIGVTVTKGGETLEEGEDVFERQILRYTVLIENTTGNTLTNFKIKGKGINANLYYLKVFETQQEDEIIQYKMPVEDDGTKEYEELIINDLYPEQTAKFEYEVVVNELDDEGDKEVYGEITVSADNLEELKIETSKNKIKEAKIALNVQLGSTETMNDTDIYAGYTIKYAVYIENLSEEDFEDVDLNVLLPDEIEYDPETFLFGYNEYIRTLTKTTSGDMITIKIPKLEAKTAQGFYLVTTVKDIDLNIIEKKISVVAKAQLGDEEYISNDYIKSLHQSKIKAELEFTSNLENLSEVKNGDKIEYQLKLKNIGSLTTDLCVCDDFDNGFKVDKILIDGEEFDEDTDNTRMIIDEFQPKQEITINIYGTIDSSEYLTDQEFIENHMEVSGYFLDQQITDTISFKIVDGKTQTTEEETLEEEDESVSVYGRIIDDEDEFDDDDDENEDDIIEEQEVVEEPATQDKPTSNSQNRNNNTTNSDNKQNSNNASNKQNNNNTKEKINNSNPNTKSNTSQQSNNNQTTRTVADKAVGKYSISGKLWIDKNKDGKIDSDEELLKNTKVKLYKAINENSVVYNSNNLVQETNSNESGEYTFTNLAEGNYIVLVEYDSETYSITEYKSKSAGESINSDFITKKLENNTVAISDILEIKNSNMNSINLGLVYNNECDVEIIKTISQIIVEDDDGKKTIDYNKENIAKIEIAAKKINKTKITIIYNFAIKNTGDIDTYITKMVDYLPEELSFDEKSNTGWHLSDDNNLYNLSLANEKIEAGKTKNIKLVVTKEINDDTRFGSYINKTKILETTNDKKLAETNLNNNESEIELLISIKTGKVIIYLTLLLCLATMGSLGTVFVKKKIIKPVYK